MNPVELVRSALAGISGNLVRSILTLLMVVIGVASVITLVAVGNGSLMSVNAQIASLGASSITVTPGYSDNESTSLHLTDAERIASTSGTAVTAVAPTVETQKRVTAGGKSAQASIIGTTPAYFDITNSVVAQGRALTSSDGIAQRNVAVISDRLAQTLFPGGDAVGSTVVADATPLVIVGVLAPRDDPMASSTQTLTVALERVQASLTGFASPLSSIVVSARSSEDVPRASEEVRGILMASTGAQDPNSFYVSNQQELRAVLGGSSQSLNDMLAGVASISLVVGGIGVTNVMLLTVRERTREIGIRKALGAKSRDIATQFTLEATMLSVLGGAIGLLLALASSAFTILGVKPVILPSSVGLALGLSVVIGVVFGTYPAIRAARMNPVEALRSGT